MDAGSLARTAALLRQRNAIDAELARLIQRPMTSGHLGEWIAAQVFGIELEASAVGSYSPSVSGVMRQVRSLLSYPVGSRSAGSHGWPLNRLRRASSLLMPHFAAVDR